MGKLDKYLIDLKGMKVDSFNKGFDLTDDYFSVLDAPEISKGQIHVDLQVKRIPGAFELLFHIEGFVRITCDRCLDDMDQSIDTDDRLLVKLGVDYSDEDDIVIIPEAEGVINVAWFIYEFIALNIPIKHTHADGKCNKTMIGQLNRHMAYVSGDAMIAVEDNADDVADSIDPRWNELKKILDNN